MRVRRSYGICVRRAPGNGREGRLLLGYGVRRVAIGRKGIAALKREGDGTTPLGRHAAREIFYRADRVPRPRTLLPVRAIRARDGWCDDPSDRNYNRLVKLPARRSAEGMRRDDHLYDLVLVLGYNDRPRVKGKGSAIFVHLARDGYRPTDGCIALCKRDMLLLLAELRSGSSLWVMG